MAEQMVAIRVIPRAGRDAVDGERDGRLLVRTNAAPTEGAANEAVRRIVAAYFGVRARDVDLVSGHRSRDKVLRITTP